MGLKSPLLRLVIAIVTGAFTWWVYVKFARYMGFQRPEFLASILLGSVFLHELGHLLSFERHGIPCAMSFVVIAGGTSPLDIKAVERLPDTHKAEAYIAGMFGNIVAVAIAAMVYMGGLCSAVDVERVANLNASLIVFNLIPLAIFDGSRFVKVLFRNIAPRKETLLFELTSVPVAVAMLALLIYKGHATPALPLVLWGLHRRSHEENHDDGAARAMTLEQRIWWAVLFTILVVGSAVVYSTTNDWILLRPT